MIGDVLAPTHLLLILVVALIVLGPKRLPEVGRSLGKSLRDFKDAVSSYSPQTLLNEDTPLPGQTVTPPERDFRREPAPAETAISPDTVDGVAVEDDAPSPAAEPEPAKAGPAETTGRAAG
jgi:sec-independent protein translocase protein TatA